MSEDDLKTEILRLKAENEALKRPKHGTLSLRVSEKGAVSVYGLGRLGNRGGPKRQESSWLSQMKSSSSFRTMIIN